MRDQRKRILLRQGSYMVCGNPKTVLEVATERRVQ